LLAGTDPNGLVLKINPQGKVFALLDSSIREMHKLAVAPDGSIYALSVSAQPTTEKTPPASTSTPTTPPPHPGATVTLTATFDYDSGSSGSTSSSSGSSSSHNDTSNAKSILYRITPDGGNDAVWTSRDAVAFSLAVDKNGQVLVGTGLKGRIYLVDPNTKT